MPGRWDARGVEAGVHRPGQMRRHIARSLPVHELIAVQAGVLPVAERDRRFAVTASDWLLLGAGRRHHGYGDLSRGTWFYWVCFSDEHTTALPMTGIWALQTGTVARPQRLRGLFAAMLEDQSAAVLTPAAASSYVRLILSEILLSSVAASARDGDNPVGRQAQAFVDARLGDPDLSTARIAAGVRCSPDYLGRVFRAVTGDAPTVYIHRRRVEQARALFRSTDLSIERVAAQVGFRDTRYFRRIFARHVGLTPGQFRKLHQHVR